MSKKSVFYQAGIGLLALIGIWLTWLHLSDAFITDELHSATTKPISINALGINWKLDSIACGYSTISTASTSFLGLPLQRQINIQESEVAFVFVSQTGIRRAVILGRGSLKFDPGCV
jgi:hypothetical protein